MDISKRVLLIDLYVSVEYRFTSIGIAGLYCYLLVVLAILILVAVKSAIFTDPPVITFDELFKLKVEFVVCIGS